MVGAPPSLPGAGAGMLAAMRRLLTIKMLSLSCVGWALATGCGTDEVDRSSQTGASTGTPECTHASDCPLVQCPGMGFPMRACDNGVCGTYETLCGGIGGTAGTGGTGGTGGIGGSTPTGTGGSGGGGFGGATGGGSVGGGATGGAGGATGGAGGATGGAGGSGG